MGEENRGETAAWSIWRSTQNAYEVCNLKGMIRESRDFYQGLQFKGLKPGTVAPQLNYIWEAVERVQAKLCGTPCRMEFISDQPEDVLSSMDDYYEYLTTELGDDVIDYHITHAGLVDGTGVCFTSWDEDEAGRIGAAKGHLKRLVVPIEECFFDDIYTEDVQDQRSVGYASRMQINAVREMVKSQCADFLSKAEIEERCNAIVPDNYFDQVRSTNEADQAPVQGTEYCTVLTRFFRIEGEVFFEVCTQYVNILPFPHALSLEVNRQILDEGKKLPGEWRKERSRDYEGIDQPRYTLFTIPTEETDEEAEKRRAKFSRYPVAIYRPYPKTGMILGDSYVSKLVPTQRTINYLNLLVTLILQSHGSPKWVAKKGAIRGQVIDDTPDQVLTDYSPVGTIGITRVNPSTAIPADIMNIAFSFAQQVERVFGFGDLTANSSADISGYAFQQQVQQQNLVLEIPQKLLWKYKSETAKSDLMYLRHYVKSDHYFNRKDDAWVSMQSNYRQMALNLDPSLAQQVGNSGVNSVTRRDVGAELFAHEYDVIPNPVQGVGQSAISQSQHINSMFQTFMQGNVKAEDLKALVMSDPSIDHKTRTTILNALESVETSQLAQLRAQNQQLQQMVDSLIQQYRQVQTSVSQLAKRAQAQEKAYKTQTQQQGAIADYMARQLDRERLQKSLGGSASGAMSEGEVKSNNARGIDGSQLAQ